ncbi:MAG: hypothetical protein ACTHXO_12070 [Actinomycetaceae bacterium]
MLATSAALVALLALAACGGGSDDDGATPDSPAPEQSTPSDTSTETATGGPDGDADVTSAVGEPGEDADVEQADADDPEARAGTTQDDEEDPAEDLPSIRDADFSVLEWRQAWTGTTVVPVDGDGLRQYVVGEQVAHADVDGDGHEDALVPLEIHDGNGFEQTWYIWRWDPEALTPVQVESPVAREARCGDTVLGIDSVAGAFVVMEALRHQDDDSLPCSELGPIQVTRHVTLQDGWPVLTGGLVGDGGICPQFRHATDNVFDAAGAPLQAAPIEGGAPLGDPAPDWWLEVDVERHPALWRPHWLLVHIGYWDPPTDVAAAGDYRPCAWGYLENDDRPIPDLGPYIEQ